MLIPRFRLAGETPCVVEVAPDGTVAESVACRHCGYDLRTQGVAGKCPECNTPVRASLRGDQLWNSDPQWIASVARGAELFAYGGIGGFVACAFWSLGQIDLLKSIGQTGVFIGVVLILVGSWLLTSPDPSGVGEDRYATIRKVARTLLILGFASMPLDTLHNHLPPGAAAELAHTLNSFCVFAGVFGLCAMLWYVRGLLLRVPNPVLADRVALQFTIILVSISLLALQMFAYAVLPLGRAAQSFKPLACCGILPLFTLVGSCLLLIWHMRTVAATLRREATMSRRFWPGTIAAGD